MICERIRCLFGRHEYKFIRNIYGDEINAVGGKRSMWRCGHCGKRQYRNFLFKRGSHPRAFVQSDHRQ